MFDKRKQDILDKQDKSKKGGIDDRVLELVKFVNGLRDYYTTSSCSGRVLLIEKNEARKDKAEWLYVTHGKADSEKVFNSLKSSGTVWFKMEAAILHICCRDIEAGEKMLNLVRDNGFKRAGIIGLSNRIIIELFGSDSMETLVVKEGKVLVDEEYVSVLVSEANSKIERNWSMIEGLLGSLMEEF